MDPQYMADWQRAEETGYWPDAVYFPSEEDLADPAHDEIAALVMEQYAVDNAARRERRLTAEITALRAKLAEHGIEWSEE
jgi:hypothetical protein